MTITLKAGQKPTKEELIRARLEYEKALKHEPVFDADSPESTPKVLAEFAAMARDLRHKQRNAKRSVSIRLSSECVEQYKSLGRGYTGIMADILSFAVKDPDILRKVKFGSSSSLPRTPSGNRQ